MVFSEPAFLFFFLPLVLLAYFVVPHGARNWVLSLASLAFYAIGEIRFVPILLVSIALNYYIALGLEAWRGTRAARWLLAFGLASDLGLLLYFKYANFLVGNFNRALEMTGSHAPFVLASVALPLGISFFTFHKMSYKIDVFRASAKVRRNPLDLALYILLFPQLIAGPIIRYHEIESQIAKRKVRLSGFAEGVRRFVIGLGKKMILADTCAYAADQIFGLPSHELTTGIAWLGLVCYTLQIYFDFSGYSDMAIGLGRMFGFRFPENFHYPYVAQSITDFWRRWHISLSRWFRDYLYIPLGGNRRGNKRTYANLFTVFFLCGLWHGASWNFVFWGIFHGIFLIFERLGLARVLQNAPRALRHFYALAVVMIGWVFFRAPDISYALVFLKSLIGFAPGDSARFNVGLYWNVPLALALAIGVLAATPIAYRVESLLRKRRAAFSEQPRPMLSWSLGVLSFVAYAIVFLVSVVLMAVGTYSPFIYYRF